MDEAAKLEILRLQLNRHGTAQDPLLLPSLKAAGGKIAQMGITLTDSASDAELQIAYAAHLFRNRANPDAQLSPDLSYDLRNRLFSEKGRVSE